MADFSAPVSAASNYQYTLVTLTTHTHTQQLCPPALVLQHIRNLLANVWLLALHKKR